MDKFQRHHDVLGCLHWAHLIIGGTTGYKYFSILHVAWSPIAHWMKLNLFSTRTFGQDDPPKTPKIITKNNLAWLTNLRDSPYPYYYRYPMLGFPLFSVFLIPIFAPNSREDKTIESAVPFPAPEIGDNRGLSPFHPRIIIVIGECPLLSPVWKSSPLPRKPLKCLENFPPSPSPVTGAGTGKGTPSFNVLKEPIFTISSTWHDLHLQQLLLCSLQ